MFRAQEDVNHAINASQDILAMWLHVSVLHSAGLQFMEHGPILALYEETCPSIQYTPSVADDAAVAVSADSIVQDSYSNYCGSFNTGEEGQYHFELNKRNHNNE
ncbi:hypothetical protein BTVI_122977 [Pitangus sulphuratus]|nr:hypothetical protein BTVI_122977 [Pitangus sulphuratus]